MDLREAIYTRRAVRAYIQEPLDRELIGGLIDAAIQAPSAVNEQAWSFCVVQDQQLLARISEASKAHMLAHHQGVEFGDGLFVVVGLAVVGDRRFGV